MNSRHVVTICAIFLLASAGWWILGTATSERSAGCATRLEKEVAALWGEPLVQQAPRFTVQAPGSREPRFLNPDANEIQVRLNTDYRRKGLIWYPTYICAFAGIYRITNTNPVRETVRMHFDFPAPEATYDDFAIQVDGVDIGGSVMDRKSGVDALLEMGAGDTRRIDIRYRTRGLSTWRYQPDPNLERIRNLHLTLETDFTAVDFTGLSPMSTQPADKGMRIEWTATDVITRADMGIIVPERLNPGPLTTRITFFAPVCLIFLFVLIASIHVLYRVRIHPMHYLFVAAGFFAFHLLLAYLVDHIHIHLAFLLSTAVSVALVTGYLRAALGQTFPWKIAVCGQLFYLVLFSYSFFLKGITGLTVAIGSVLTLAALMKVTAHVDWYQFYGGKDNQRTEKSLQWDVKPAGDSG